LTSKTPGMQFQLETHPVFYFTFGPGFQKIRFSTHGSNMKKLLHLLLACTFLAPATAQILPQVVFNTVLSGAEEVPAVTTNGRGLITLMFNPDRSKLIVTGLLTQLDGTVTAANLHIGNRGEEGAVVLNLLPIISGRKIAGELDVPPGLISQLFADQVYASIRTTAHPDGEIRGQMAAETDLNFKMHFSGDQMVPAVASGGLALGSIHFPVGAGEILFVFGGRGLSGPIIGAAIYNGQPGSNGTLVGNLAIVPPGDLVVGVVELDELEPDFINNALAGKYYVMVKTIAFPNGELRSQISFAGYLNSFFNASSYLNIPKNTSTAFGLGYTVPNATLDSLTTIVLLNGISPTAGYVRRGLPDQNGPVVHALTPSATPGIYQTTYPIQPADLTEFIENRLYPNFTSAAYPDGEIRGQMNNSLRRGYAFDLCGNQEVPPNASTAFGMGMFSVDQADCYINYRILVDGLSGTPSSARIGQGAVGTTGVKMYDMLPTSPLLTGFRGIDPVQGPIFENQGTFINIYTPTYPTGEVRGQIRRGLSCPVPSGTSEADFAQVRFFPNPVVDAFFVRAEHLSGFSGRLIARDFLGKTLLTVPVSFTHDDETMRVSARSLSPGVFWLTLEAADGKTVSTTRMICTRY